MHFNLQLTARWKDKDYMVASGRDKTPIWFMYITNAVQLLMVRIFKVVLVLIFCGVTHKIFLGLPGCECFSEPSNILLCRKNFQRGHHQPCQVGNITIKERKNNLLVFDVAFNNLFNTLFHSTSYFVFWCC